MLLEKEKRTMTLEETIKQATPLGGVYQHACPGGWTAYAGKNHLGHARLVYVKDTDPKPIHSQSQEIVKRFSVIGKPAPRHYDPHKGVEQFYDCELPPNHTAPITHWLRDSTGLHFLDVRLPDGHIVRAVTQDTIDQAYPNGEVLPDLPENT
jgi:hypothetical protein